MFIGITDKQRTFLMAIFYMNSVDVSSKHGVR